MSENGLAIFRKDQLILKVIVVNINVKSVSLKKRYRVIFSPLISASKNKKRDDQCIHTDDDKRTLLQWESIFNN